MTYDALGAGPLDYLPCRYGTSKLLFRGPRRNLDNKPYIAFVGGTETYGKYIEKPFPALIEEEIGLPSVNFGYPNAGVDAFTHDPFVVGAAAEAKVSVVQVMGAANMTNRFYSVHPRRNDRFTGASTLLKTIYREVDFAEFHFNRHLLGELARVSPQRFDAVRTELQQAWLGRMRAMLGQMKGKTILLWFGAQAPNDGVNPDDPHCLGPDPLFITQEMMDELAGHATDVVTATASPMARADGTDGMVYDDLEEMAAAEMLGPRAHVEASEKLCASIRALI